MRRRGADGRSAGDAIARSHDDGRTRRRDVVELDRGPLRQARSGTPTSRRRRCRSRTWSTYHIAALWIGMSVVITTYTLASGLMQQGMTWWQAMVTILLGNTIVLVPMMLNAHAGTKYGVSFPVLCRASFGVRGANVPAILRALVACGWFGIQTWIGGAGAEHAAGRGVAGVARLRRRHGLDLVRGVLAGAGRDHHPRPRGHQEARELVGAAAAGGGALLLMWAVAARRRPRAHPRGVERGCRRRTCRSGSCSRRR